MSPTDRWQRVLDEARRRLAQTRTLCPCNSDERQAELRAMINWIERHGPAGPPVYWGLPCQACDGEVWPCVEFESAERAMGMAPEGGDDAD